MREIPIKQTVVLVLLGVVLLTGLLSIGKLVEFNEAGIYQVKQSVSGELEVITTPGPYFQGWGTITSYQASEVFELSKGESDEPIKVRFSDGGTAMVSGSVQFIIPNDEKSLLEIHQYFRTSDSLRSRVLRQTFVEAVQQTAGLMKADESYSTRRSEFASLVEEQVRRGLFETVAVEAKEKDVDGNEFNDVNIVIKVNEKGQRVINKPSPLLKYGITVAQITIKDFDYDDTIDALIAKKKEAEQQKVVARSNAERSKQDKITAEQKALADVAIAKGAEEVEKIKEVTRAQKEKEVAILSAQKDFETAKLARETAEQNAKAAEVKGRAEAAVAQLKVNAGLTPQEKAEFEVKKADVVSKNLASIQLPSMMVIGGGNGSSGAADPFTAIGIESLMRINDKLSNGK
jgi:regulator of protease activity HflC (stomatin/prohibitin superfamily)